MSNKIYIARQPIKNINGKIVGYELLYRDSPDGIKEFPSHIKATSHVLVSALTHLDLNDIVKDDQLFFINVDEKILLSGVLELLDREKCVIEILEDTAIDQKVKSKIKRLKALGFKIAIDDFDGSIEMIERFNPIWKDIDILKVDAISMNEENIIKLIPKFQKNKIKLLIEKIETKEELKTYFDLGFNLFQGYYIGKPEVISCRTLKDATQLIILKLVALIKTNAETTEIVKFIKKRPELVMNIMKFINNRGEDKKVVQTVTQAITLMGREGLNKWLILYLYSEIHANSDAHPLLKNSLKRAEAMEKASLPKDKDMAFMTGLFSMAGDLFEEDTDVILRSIRATPVLVNAITRKMGPFGKMLQKREFQERDFLKKMLNDNFDKIPLTHIMKLLEHNNIKHY